MKIILLSLALCLCLAACGSPTVAGVPNTDHEQTTIPEEAALMQAKVV